MKNNDIDKEKILSNADNADMETSMETTVKTSVKTSGETSGETPMETSVEHMLKSARDNPPKVPASLFDAVVADAIRLNPHTNKITNTPTNTPANLNTPPIYALAGLAACLCVGFIAGIGYLNSADGAEILTALWGDDSDITTLSALINIAD